MGPSASIWFTPSDDEINAIRPGDCVKIGIATQTRGQHGERFWATAVLVENGFVKAIVTNVLMTINWPVGKCIQFPVERIYKVEVPQERA